MIYIIILFILLWFTFSSTSGHRRRVLIYISGSILVLLAGLKYRVGTDALLYQDLYEVYPTIGSLTRDYVESSRWGSLFIYFYSVCHTFLPQFIYYQFIHAIIVSFSICILFYRHTERFFPALVLYFVNYYLYFTFDLYREGLAVSVFYLSYELFLLKRKWIPYFLCCIICYNIHVSSFTIFFIPLLLKIRLTRTNALITFCVVIAISFFLNRYLEAIVSFLPLNAVNELALTYILRSDNANGASVMRLFYSIVAFYIAIYRNIGKINENQKTILNLAYVSVIILALDKAVPFIFRLNSYYIIFFFIAVAMFLEREIFKMRNKINIMVSFIIITLILSSPILTGYIYNESTRHAYFPYISMFEKKKIKEREWHDTDAFLEYDQ